MQKFSPCLWFDGQAEEAAGFYVSVFDNSRIISRTYCQDGVPAAAGTVMTVRFALDGEEFVALNGGRPFSFSPALSLVAYCENQDEIDHLWTRLGEGGQAGPCGWLNDRFGVSWQVVPIALLDMLGHEDETVTRRVVAALNGMDRIQISGLIQAYENAGFRLRPQPAGERPARRSLAKDRPPGPWR
jgi:predicted 3-demethylubiquinone-9 3-methyltransferase (glyoxalase superfamily)